MALPNAYQAYANSKLMTATPAQLTLMLYDGAIKFTNIAIQAVEENDYGKANTYIQKTERIIEEFRNTLDFKYPVAQEFENVYKMIAEKLLYANMKKDAEVLQEVLKYLRIMRDTWEEVMKLAKR
ncbi:MAG: flagellar export chaperone FliS [Lachnospiraceae bacterium]|nr:flagellar export chaperone FliS [Lachnospiraceae bacterium]